MMCAGGAAWAQGSAPPKPARAVAPADSRAMLEAGFATVAARGAWTAERTPSRSELIGILMFMSLRGSNAHGA
jgi:hypothetical protein